MQLTEGNYKYKRPHWESWTQVKVEKNNGVMFVRFSNERYPVKLDDIPADAIFERE